MTFGEKIFYLFLLLLFCSPAIIKYLRTHPRINMAKLNKKIEEANQKRIRYDMAEQLISDTEHKELDRLNIRAKYITITWSDNFTKQEKQLTFYVTGTNEETKKLAELARTIRKSTCNDIKKISYSMPKAHSKAPDKPKYITTKSGARIHGIK